jgi:uncharacterized cupin superfamily protein
MPVTEVQRIDRASGVKVVPSLSDYDGHSETWVEAEYRAAPIGTRSIAGYWEGEPGWVRIDRWPYNEVCVILEGSVAIADEAGTEVVFGSGEAFLVPAGFRGVWRTVEPTRKIFVGLMADRVGEPA